MKTVGLKIERGVLAAAVLQKGFRQVEIKDSFIRAFTTDAELVEILKEKAAEWAGARIVSSIPGKHFSHRSVRFPFSDRKRIEKALPFEIEDSVPFSLEDVVLDHMIVVKGKSVRGQGAAETGALGIALPKDVLRRHLELLSSAGIDPQVIVPSYAGLHAVSNMMKTEGCTLLVCGRDVCLKSGDSVRAIRGFTNSGPTGGIRHTLQSLETEYKERVERASLLSEDAAVQAELMDLGISIEHASPELNGKKADDPVSLGLAFAGDMNFRKGEFSYRLADAGIRKRRRTLYVAGAAAALLAAVNLGVKLYLVQSSYGRLDAEIKALFHQTFPDSRIAGDPVRLMRDKIEEARKKLGVLGAGTSVLDSMKAVTEGIPKELNVNFLEFNLEGELLKLQGEALSFESVDRMKAELLKAPQFAEVTVQDTRMGVQNKVKFRIEIRLKDKI